MAANVATGQTQTMIGRDFSWIQRLVLRRYHPRSVFIDTVGLVWFTYYFWNHNWQSAIGALIVARAIALISAMNIKTDLFAETMLGKIGLLHLNPFNLVMQVVGIVVLLYGIWDHSPELILGGVSFILLGHVFGWQKVDSRLGDAGQ